MKNLKFSFLLVLLAFAVSSFAQSSARKNHLSAGFGKQNYNGDLGNNWFMPEEEFYGFISLGYSRYLTHSLDASVNLTSGDLGHCRMREESPVRPDGSEVLNMLMRLTSGVISLKYKFANGYLLKESSRFAPYLYGGIGLNNATNIWRFLRVDPGNYFSLNGGLGLRFNFTEMFNCSYNVGFSYLTSDKIDLRQEGRSDMMMQQTLLVGFDF